MAHYVVESYDPSIDHGGRDSAGVIPENRGSEKIYLHVIPLADDEIKKLGPRVDENGNQEHARLALPRHRADLPTRDYLAAERDGMIAQAGMLEAVWRWYLAPCAIGVVGFVVSARGITPKTLGYAAVVVGFCVLLHVANRAAARHFRTLADDIREQVAAFERSNEP